MKLSDLIKNYYCFNCHLKHSGNPICPYCGKKSKHIGYKSPRMSHTKLNNQEQRKKHRKNLTQPYRDGEFSAEFKEYFPDKARDMVKKKVITKEQYKKAKPVWKDKADVL